MIINSFDDKSPAKINPQYKDNRIKCDACIVTFSNIIEKYVLDNYDIEECATYKMVTGTFPIYKINYQGKVFAFYKTLLGAPASVGIVEDVTEVIDTDKFIVFGGAGCLDKVINHGKIMVPTESYRDEGTSYHYATPSDYIINKNSNVVKEFLESKRLPYVLGKNWTTDAFYRETENNITKRKNDGCISVDMECSAMQAVCDFRNLELYYFFTSADLLDSPEWDIRHIEGEYAGTQHDTRYFDLAIELAYYVSN